MEVTESDVNVDSSANDTHETSHWSNIKPPETKSRDEEMEEYLQDLLL